MSSFIVLDLDDTIVPCGVHYMDAKNEFFALMGRIFAASVTRQEVSAIYTEISHESYRKIGASRERFPATLVDTYRALSEKYERFSDAQVIEDIRLIGEGVFRPELYAPFPGAVETLRAYREAGVRLGLCTKGDESVQWGSKLIPHQLDKLFDHVEVVPKKGAAEIAAVADKIRQSTGAEGYMIGDSMPEDIVGGREAGLRTVLVKADRSGYGGVPEQKVSGIKPDYTISSLSEMSRILPLAIPPVARRRR